MKQVVRKAKIIGTGSFVPSKVVTNKELELTIKTSDEWIRENLGIKERRIAGAQQCTSDLASEAALKAIQNANLQVSDIDLIIVATATPDRLAPSTACIVQDKISAWNAVCFDIAAVCSGFLFAMSTGSQFIASGVYDNVLIIGADTFSRITDWTRRDAVFFGDGAGAVVLSHAKSEEGFMAFRLYSDGRGKWNFTVPAGGSEMPLSQEVLNNKLNFFQMNGRAVYETGTKVLPKAIFQVLSDSNLSIEDIDLLVPHQPSIKILQETAKIIGLPFDRVFVNMEKYANTSGATIPLALDEAVKSGRIKSGNNILFAAVGSGWTYGASIIKWGF